MKYEAVIGLEVHIQVRTASKMFCSCANAYGAEPNTLVCPVCMGYPGVLPVPNHEAILKTVKAGLLTNCEIARFSKFDRKSYFYPDMPKNYQISQYDLPFCIKGRLHIGGKGFSGNEMADKDIGITRIHLEEDVAKLTHFGKFSGVDYNRAGVPLMETVSEPDLRSADEAYAYLTSLQEIMRYGGISDCDMEKGQMRCDVNISIRPEGADYFGTKIELKNLNSFRSVHRAIEYEVARQSELVDGGVQLRQETRGWNDEHGETYLMRTKEAAHDYRYFPDPDLMPVTFTQEEIDAIRQTLPELPAAKRARFIARYGVTEYDADILTATQTSAAYFETAAKSAKNAKLLANWFISELLRVLNAADIDIAESPIKPEALAELANLVNDKTINGKVAKDLLDDMLKTGRMPAEMVRERGLAQVSDAGSIEPIVDAVIADNAPQVAQYRDGNPKVIQFFVGQVMKRSRGKANPAMALELLKQKLK